MLNHKTIFKQKSKILLVFICIFGLILYYGCGRDDDGGITDPTSFSISEATGNVKTSIVQSVKTFGELKIGFAASHDYTMDYTVDDANETVEANKIDKTDFKVENNVLTASDSLLTKVRALNTDKGPAEKTITINFTFKANDTNLKNNTQTLSVEVKLTHAQKPADDTAKKTFMETVLQKGSDVQITEGTGPEAKRQVIETTKGTFDTANNTFTAKPTLDKGVKINKTSGDDALKAFTDYYFENQYKPYIASYTYDKAEGGGTSDDYYSLTYKDITFTDKYECDITTITFKFEKGKSDTWGD